MIQENKPPTQTENCLSQQSSKVSYESIKVKQPNQKSVPNITPLNSNIIPQMPRSVKRKLAEYEFSTDQKIGSGLTSDVYLGINTKNNQQVCVKVIDKLNFSKDQQKKMLENQIRCHRLFKDQNIVQLYDIFETQSFTFIISEFCDHGDLYKLIKYTKNGLDQKLARTFIKDIARGLNQMKKKQIVHRDIKSENILLRRGVAKLGDFGFAIQSQKLNEKERFNCGSPLYMSPEVLKSNKYSFSSDVFAFGIVIYEMLHKQSPWECSNEDQLRKKIMTQPVQFKSGLSSQIKSLIKGCLQLQSSKRITIQQILELQYLKDTQQQQSEKIRKAQENA